MLKNKIENYVNERYDINVHLQKIIKHISLDESAPFFVEDSNWYINNDELIIIDNHDDEFAYTISSLGKMGIDLFMGESDGYTYVMVYPEGDSWEYRSILILDNKKMLNNR
jgi:hypothetical protein